jgi:NAD(P)-dependent dehydrogenase (short-subunit alcohol dehydrogenase family)
MKLNGKIALVTGGTSGIGLAAAALFRAEGAQVVVVGNDRDRLASAASMIGPDTLALGADLRQPAEIGRVIEAIRERFGRLDVVFANAGLGLAAPLEAVTEANIDEQFAVNFKGLFFTVQKAVPLMGQGRQRRVDHVLPQCGRRAGPVDPLGHQGGGALAGQVSGRRAGAARHPG